MHRSAAAFIWTLNEGEVKSPDTRHKNTKNGIVFLHLSVENVRQESSADCQS